MTSVIGASIRGEPLFLAYVDIVSRFYKAAEMEMIECSSNIRLRDGIFSIGEIQDKDGVHFSITTLPSQKSSSIIERLYQTSLHPQ
jgi:hypothetical protein